MNPLTGIPLKKPQTGDDVMQLQILLQQMGHAIPDAQVRGWQRGFKITPHYPQMKLLLTLGLDSAHRIASLGKDNFVQLYNQAILISALSPVTPVAYWRFDEGSGPTAANAAGSGL